MTISQFKANFSEVIELVKNGEKVAVTFGRKKEIIGYFVGRDSFSPEQPMIKLGILEGKAKFTFSPDFKMTTEQFLGLEE